MYADVAEAVSARLSGIGPDPLALYFPGAEDGLAGVEFVNSVIESDRNSGEWTKCRKLFDGVY